MPRFREYTVQETSTNNLLYRKYTKYFKQTKSKNMEFLSNINITQAITLFIIVDLSFLVLSVVLQFYGVVEKIKGN